MTSIALGPWSWKRYERRRPSVRMRAALVALELDVVVAGLGVEGDPVEHRRAADHVELVLGEVEQDHVADDVAVGRARDELLGLVDGEAGKACSRRGVTSSASASGPRTASSAMW